jgi:hypothetical protein
MSRMTIEPEGDSKPTFPMSFCFSSIKNHTFRLNISAMLCSFRKNDLPGMGWHQAEILQPPLDSTPGLLSENGRWSYPLTERVKHGEQPRTKQWHIWWLGTRAGSFGTTTVIVCWRKIGKTYARIPRW